MSPNLDTEFFLWTLTFTTFSVETAPRHQYMRPTLYRKLILLFTTQLNIIRENSYTLMWLPYTQGWQWGPDPRWGIHLLGDEIGMILLPTGLLTSETQPPSGEAGAGTFSVSPSPSGPRNLCWLVEVYWPKACQATQAHQSPLS